MFKPETEFQKIQAQHNAWVKAALEKYLSVEFVVYGRVPGSKVLARGVFKNVIDKDPDEKFLVAYSRVQESGRLYLHENLIGFPDEFRYQRLTGVILGTLYQNEPGST